MPVHARYFCVDASRDPLFDVYTKNSFDDQITIGQVFANENLFMEECRREGEPRQVSSDRSVVQFWARNNETLFDISRITIRVGNVLIKYFYIYHIGELRIEGILRLTCHVFRTCRR